MERFIAKQNIDLFARQLEGEADEARRVVLQSLLRDARRDLALIDAERYGAGSGVARLYWAPFLQLVRLSTRRYARNSNSPPGHCCSSILVLA